MRTLFLLLLGTLSFPLFAAEVRLGLGYDRGHDGHGFDLHRAGNEVVLYFYSYDSDGDPEWFFGTGKVAEGRASGELRRARYDAGADPANRVTTTTLGSFLLDYNAPGDDPACQDGVDRSGAEQRVVFDWHLGKESGRWCVEFLRIDADTPMAPYAGGVWYAGPSDPGYGFSSAHMGERLNAIVYYYDTQGEPRWALGVGDPNAPIDLSRFRGYCRLCTPTPLRAEPAGRLDPLFEIRTGAPSQGAEQGVVSTGAEGVATLTLTDADAAARFRDRDFELFRLTDGAARLDTQQPEPQPTEAEASRFLSQATFGPTTAEVARLRTLGIDAWLDEQLSLPMTPLYAPLRAEVDRWAAEGRLCNGDDPDAEEAGECRFDTDFITDRRGLWWVNAIRAPDQLRQRMTFALSQLMVVSDRPEIIADRGIEIAAFYDKLGTHAFGNFRDLLLEVSLDPFMGVYLTFAGNRKADPVANTRPDENYAREVMQLFSIGLVTLESTGLPRRDTQGATLPSYGQDDIRALARVFTGFAFAEFVREDCEEFEDFAAEGVFPIDPTRRMGVCPAYHDTGAKTVLGTTIPAGQGALADVRSAVDLLVDHPNTPPFISRQLIQRLVASDPSPAYVRRVARVFTDNGRGVRGDLAAVVRAILADPEARRVGTAVNAGKLKEPILRTAAVLRAFDGLAIQNQGLDAIGDFLEGTQIAQSAPSVFNFFRPSYRPPGPLSEAGIIAPEFNLAAGSTLVRNGNELDFHTRLLFRPIDPQDEELAEAIQDIRLDYRPLLPLLDDPAVLVERLALLLTADRLTRDQKRLLIERAQQQMQEYGEAGFGNNAVLRGYLVGELVFQITALPEFLVDY
ncbi:MAG: DUF1800 domain-containing protein [Pseudomonadota bacterium]